MSDLKGNLVILTLKPSTVLQCVVFKIPCLVFLTFALNSTTIHQRCKKAVPI